MALLCRATDASAAENPIREDERGDEEKQGGRGGTADKRLFCRQKIFPLSG